MDKKKLQKIEEASEAAEKEVGRPNILDVLLDEDNKDPIVLVDDKGKQLSFEQIAVIPYNDKVYCVLKPIDEIENVQDDEAIVFYVDEREGREPVLVVETDEKTAINVFDEYYNLLDEAESKK
ncbi:MAG: DUF1292 domain-containing protein [Candidatus Caccovivens sp.]